MISLIVFEITGGVPILHPPRPPDPRRDGVTGVTGVMAGADSHLADPGRRMVRFGVPEVQLRIDVGDAGPIRGPEGQRALYRPKASPAWVNEPAGPRAARIFSCVVVTYRPISLPLNSGCLLKLTMREGR